MSDPNKTSPNVAYRRRRWGYLSLAILGVALIVLQVLLNVLPMFHYAISPWSMLVSAAIGFWGFHGLDPRNADAAGSFIAKTATSVIVAIRSGRRSTDVVQLKDVPVTTEHPAVTPGDAKGDLSND